MFFGIIVGVSHRLVVVDIFGIGVCKEINKGIRIVGIVALGLVVVSAESVVDCKLGGVE